MKYTLLTDNSVQWFTYLVSMDDDDNYIDFFPLDMGIKNDYLSNIFNRELSFSNLRFKNPVISSEMAFGFYGNWISKYDYERIKRMIQLYPQVKEFERLGKLE